MLSIPERGLDEVLRAWSGQGQLWEAMAAVSTDDVAQRAWSSIDIRRRAHRILFAELEPLIARWPRSLVIWVDAMPAETIRPTVAAGAPFSGVSWTQTRTLNWPPKSFVGRARSRIADTFLVTTLRWLIEELGVVYRDAIAVESTLADSVRSQLDAAFSLQEVEPLMSAEPVPPARADIVALRTEGSPWYLVAPVAEELWKVSETMLAELARRMVMPSDELRWRLFHLGVLGEVLIALSDSGAELRSVRPLSASTTGPAYEVKDPQGRSWDLWFEAAGAWSYYNASSPYVRVAAGLPGSRRSLGADVMLISRGHRALIIECKYSADPAVVARGGYEQASAYANEARTELAPETWSVVVGPESIVDQPRYADTVAGKIGITPPSALHGLVSAVL